MVLSDVFGVVEGARERSEVRFRERGGCRRGRVSRPAQLKKRRPDGTWFAPGSPTLSATGSHFPLPNESAPKHRSVAQRRDAAGLTGDHSARSPVPRPWRWSLWRDDFEGSLLSSWTH
mgnify:CR=1 FL=1